MTLEQITPFWVELRDRSRDFVARYVPGADEGTIDDVLSDTYLEIARALPDYRHQNRAGLFAWMIQMLRYKCRTVVKARGRRRECSSDLLFEPSVYDTYPQEQEQEAYGGPDLQATLDQAPLTRAEREYIEMMLADLDRTTIAEKLQCSYDAVRKRHDRAMERLRAFGRGMQLQPGMQPA